MYTQLSPLSSQTYPLNHRYWGPIDFFLLITCVGAAVLLLYLHQTEAHRLHVAELRKKEREVQRGLRILTPQIMNCTNTTPNLTSTKITEL